jgi:hypothetical protein
MIAQAKKSGGNYAHYISSSTWAGFGTLLENSRYCTMENGENDLLFIRRCSETNLMRIGASDRLLLTRERHRLLDK